VCAATQPGEPRALWASNRVCEAAVRHRKQEQHLHNLRNVKPQIDNRDPRRPKSTNGKAQRLLEERNNQIMHENTILLNKLSRILTREPEPVREPMLVKGLNDNHKKGERERIDRENQALLRRLQDVRSSIDHEAAEAQYRLHEDLLRAHAMNFVPNPFMSVDADLGASGRPSSSMSAARAGSSSSLMGGERGASRQGQRARPSTSHTSRSATPGETEVPAAMASASMGALGETGTAGEEAAAE
jgi:hypothetical protein